MSFIVTKATTFKVKIGYGKLDICLLFFFKFYDMFIIIFNIYTGSVSYENVFLICE